MSTYAMMNDLTKCIGCRACQVACKEWNELQYEHTYFTNTRDNPPRLDSNTYTRIEHMYLPDEDPSLPQRWFFRRHMCNHCEDAACVAACPVAALQKSDDGPVSYAAGLCIGCRYCMLACPFTIPKYEWDVWKPYVKKCTMCADRIAAGEEPACAKSCLTDAITFGTREEILADAHARTAADPERYQDHVYGEEDVGGLSIMYLSTGVVPMTRMRFRDDLGNRAFPSFTWSSLSKVPYIAIGMAVLMTIIYFITQRRMPEAAKK